MSTLPIPGVVLILLHSIYQLLSFYMTEVLILMLSWYLSLLECKLHQAGILSVTNTFQVPEMALNLEQELSIFFKMNSPPCVVKLCMH